MKKETNKEVEVETCKKHLPSSSFSSPLSRSTSAPGDPLVPQCLPDPLPEVSPGDLRRCDPAVALGPTAAAAASAANAASAAAAKAAPAPSTTSSSKLASAASALVPELKPQVFATVLPRHPHHPLQHPAPVLRDPFRRPPRRSPPARRRARGPARERGDSEGVEAAEDARVVAAPEAEVFDAAVGVVLVVMVVVGGFFFSGKRKRGRERESLEESLF